MIIEIFIAKKFYINALVCNACLITSKICHGIFFDILSEIRRHHWLAFGFTHLTVLVVFANSTFLFQQKKMNKCIRMGITAFKFVTWGGKSAVLRPQITF